MRIDLQKGLRLGRPARIESERLRSSSHFSGARPGERGTHMVCHTTDHAPLQPALAIWGPIREEAVRSKAVDDSSLRCLASAPVKKSWKS